MACLLSVRSLLSRSPAITHSRLYKSHCPKTDILRQISSVIPDVQADVEDRVLEARARHMSKYLFPMQYGLHNVFTAQKIRFAIPVDYEDRESEILVRCLPDFSYV